jgi:hypothetical protein
MDSQEETTQLEAQRDRLRSMIAYHNRYSRGLQSSFPAPAWLDAPVPTWINMVAVAALGVTVACAIQAAFAGEVVLAGFLFLLVALPSLAYLMMVEITMFGVKSTVVDFLAGGPTPGEPETLQRLAECEARIMKLKEGRQ